MLYTCGPGCVTSIIGGHSTHTGKYAPWDLVFNPRFPEEHAAVNFERYLKNGFQPCVCAEALAPRNDLLAPGVKSWSRSEFKVWRDQSLGQPGKRVFERGRAGAGRLHG